MFIGLKDELGAVRILGRHDGKPATSAVPQRDVVLLLESQRLGVEPQGLLLVINEHARQVDLHRASAPTSGGSACGPTLCNCLQRFAVERVKLVPSLSPCNDQH